MDINLTGFKATTSIKPSKAITADPSHLKDAVQTICNLIPHDNDIPKFWSMVRYDAAGKHNNQSVEALTGIILEYEKRYESDLLTALLRLDLPFQYLLVETERKSGLYLSLFFPLAFQPDVANFMRIAGVLAYQLGVYGLSAGSGTPTFLVKLVGGQTVGEHQGPAIGQSFIKETQDIGEGSKTALDDFQGPKPVQVRVQAQMEAAFQSQATKMNELAAPQKAKEKQIAAQFRILADLFDPE